MKRIIQIEIECDDVYCGNCVLKKDDCAIKFDDTHTGKRGKKCLDSEVASSTAELVQKLLPIDLTDGIDEHFYLSEIIQNPFGIARGLSGYCKHCGKPWSGGANWCICPRPRILSELEVQRLVDSVNTDHSE